MSDSRRRRTTTVWAVCQCVCVAIAIVGCRGASDSPPPEGSAEPTPVPVAKSVPAAQTLAPVTNLSDVLALDLKAPTEPDPDSPLSWWNADVAISPARVPDREASQALLALRRQRFEIQVLPAGKSPGWTPLAPGAVTLPECRAVRLRADLAGSTSLYERDRPDLAAGIAQLRAFAKAVGAPPPKTNQTVAQARGRIEALEALLDSADTVPQADIRVVAARNKPFPARKAYDVLTAMGLKRVDFDCLALLSSDALGADFLMTVDGGDASRCFSEARLADETFDALVWRMRVPRTPEPEAVFAAMWRGAQAIATALGGKVMVVGRDEPADRKAMAANVAKTVRTMRAAGIEPGGHAALVMSWE